MWHHRVNVRILHCQPWFSSDPGLSVRRLLLGLHSLPEFPQTLPLWRSSLPRNTDCRGVPRRSPSGLLCYQPATPPALHRYIYIIYIYIIYTNFHFKYFFISISIWTWYMHSLNTLTSFKWYTKNNRDYGTIMLQTTQNLWPLSW